MTSFRKCCVALACLVAMCSNNSTADAGAGQASMVADKPAAPRHLDPLPEPPPVDVKPEALPGARGELAVVASRPQGKMEGEVRPTVTFSKPVKSLEMVEDQRAKDRQQPFAKISPSLAGEWRWLGSATAEFVPKSQVPYSTEFEVTIFKGLRALDGSQLAEDHTFSFSTPVLQLEEGSPYQGYTWMKPDETVSLLFNQPVKSSDLEKHSVFEVEGARYPVKVVGKISIAEERRQEEAKAKGQGRFYPRQSFEERGFKNQQTRYKLVSAKPFPKGSAVALRIDGELHGEQGPLPMGNGLRLDWRTYGPLEINEVSCGTPRGPIVIETSNEVDKASLKGRVKLDPPVEIDWERTTTQGPHAYYGGGRPRILLAAAYKPATRYQVSIDAGIKDIFGQSLAKPFSGAASTTEYAPRLWAGGGLALIEKSAGPRFPVEVLNISTLDVELYKLSPEELAKVLLPKTDDRWRRDGKPDATEEQKLSYPRNLSRSHPIDFSKLFAGKPTGVAVVDLNSPDLPHYKRGRQDSRTVVQVTDLAAHLKIGPKKSLAWITRLSTGLPVEGAEVRLYAPGANQLWTGKTDAQGFADVPSVAELMLGDPSWGAVPLLAIAIKDDDFSATSTGWSEGISAADFGIAMGWEGNNPEPHGFLFADRGIYRPGDKVFLKGVARFRQVGELKSPAEGSTIAVTVNDSQGRAVKNAELRVSRFGTFDLSLELPKDCALGSYSVSARGSIPGGPLSFGGGFQVEEYRAPQFKVDVALKGDLVAGEPLEAKLFARYLFGGAMNGAKAKWSVQSGPTTFAPAAGNGFTFGQETWWWSDERPRRDGGLFAAGVGELDAQGTLLIKAGNVEAPANRPYLYTVEGEVEDVNRQAVANRASLTVHPASYYVGLRPAAGFLTAKKPSPIEALVLDTSGARVAGKEIELTVVSRTWKSIKRKDAAGGFATVSEPVETEVARCKLESQKQPVSCSFTPEQGGFFIARATVADEKGRKHSSSLGMYAVGAGFVAWQRNDTGRIDLLPDKASYDIGEVAHVLVKSPYPEAAGLFTLEREGVLERRQLKLVGSAQTIDIPITEEMVPNVFASVMLVRPRVVQGGIESGDDPGRPAVRVGMVELKVERKVKRLSVALATDKADYRPGETVEASVEVKGRDGKPARAEVTLYAVDEAVLRLTDYRTPDPIAYIFPDRPLSVYLSEPLLNLVRKRPETEKGIDPGGGGGRARISGEGKGLRSNFQTTVLFNPAVLTDDKGQAKVRIQLPDNLTTYRLMAVAITEGDRFGWGEKTFEVNKRLLAMEALPRFARVGDRFEAGVVLHSFKGGAGSVAVTASVSGARLLGPAERRVEIAEGKPLEVRFPFTADEPGQATFRFRAKLGENEDGVEIKIPIELPVLMEAVATYGDTKDERVEGVIPPGGVRPELGGLEVTLSSTALSGLEQGFQQLIDYPYGCLEQQSSRLVPLVALREIAGKFDVPWPGAEKRKQEQVAQFESWMRGFLFGGANLAGISDPDQLIRETIKSILKLQAPNGGFRYWSDSTCVSEWGTAWATLTLSRAKDVGFEVPEDPLDRALQYVDRTAAGNCDPCLYGCDSSLETRTFAAYVLNRAHRAKPSYYGGFFEKRKALSLFAQALLADAMFTGNGDRVRARELLQEILNHAKESPKGLHFEETQSETYATLFQSDTRTTAVVLQTLTDISPDHPFVAKLAHYLTGIRQGNGQWRSTQESAWSLIGLTELLRTKEKDAPDFRAVVSLGGATLAQEEFRGRSLVSKSKSIPMSELAKRTSGKEGLLNFEKQGTGVLYYSALMRYAPAQLPLKPLDAGLYVQRWFEPYEGGGQAKRFNAGDLIRVRLRVASNQERNWAAFEVPLPAGLEAVNTSLSTTAQLPRGAGEEGSGGYEYESDEDQFGGSAYEAEGSRGYLWRWTFYSPFNHVEQRDSKVVLFADTLPPGVHTTSFVARATTPGTFVLKPASGALMYEPEVFGRSEGGVFEVVSNSQIASK